MVLDAVTLGVTSSELIVIEGAAASGKSILLELAAVVRAPNSGTVWFAGRNTATLQRASLPFVRRNIGYYGPDPLLLEDEDALGNVMLALAVRGESPRVAESSAREALELVGASHLIGKKISSLSSGQKRLVALARALAGPPPLVVVDELASTASEEARTLAVSALTSVRDKGAAVLCATADSLLADKLVRARGRKINLEQGRIVGAPPIGLVPDLTPSPQPDNKVTSKVITLEMDKDDPKLVLPPATKGPG
jgi:ABC-type ATPase involved in cell division